MAKEKFAPTVKSFNKELEGEFIRVEGEDLGGSINVKGIVQSVEGDEMAVTLKKGNVKRFYISDFEGTEEAPARCKMYLTGGEWQVEF